MPFHFIGGLVDDCAEDNLRRRLIAVPRETPLSFSPSDLVVVRFRMEECFPGMFENCVAAMTRLRLTPKILPSGGWSTSTDNDMKGAGAVLTCHHDVVALVKASRTVGFSIVHVPYTNRLATKLSHACAVNIVATWVEFLLVALSLDLTRMRAVS